MKKDIVLVGRQGSGKGTQGRLLAEKFGYKIFETGAVLREKAKDDSPLGKKIHEITARGDLVPNEVVMELVADFIKQTPPETPIIFDGIPRFEEQRKTFEEELEKAGRSFMVLEIQIPSKVAVHRLLERAKIEKREDDNLTAIQNRIENFERHTIPMLEVWKKQGKVITVDGTKSIEEVHKDIVKALNLDS